jgi:serine/threonine-protein kinase RsbW
MRTLSILKMPAKTENLEELVKSVSNSAKQNGIDAKRIIEIELALEEAIVNIINYAYPLESGDVQVACMLDESNHFIIEIEDTGIPFDALSINEPDVISEISERKIGGLGIFLIKKLMKKVQYQRKENTNVLSLSVS